MDVVNFNFLCNNVKGSKKSKKRLKLFQYFKNKIFPNGILLLQESHSTKEKEIKRKDKLYGNLYFSHGKSNSWGVLIGFSGKKTFIVKKSLCDGNGRVMILEILIDDSVFNLINFCNANIENE